MVNIANVLLRCVARTTLLINKGIPLNNFIHIFFIYVLWLFINCIYMNKCEKGLILNRYTVLFGAIILAIKTKSYLLFYIFFELRILPVIIIIFLFGYQPEKLNASLSLVLYTAFGRLPLLIYILYFGMNFTNLFVSIPMTLCFMVKTPIYLLHIWLPKAHVEAPVGGSIVLAGALLKLGSYGLLLFLPLIKLNLYLRFLWAISVVGSVVCSLICFRQGDLKLLIAYSSIVHIGVITLGFVRATELGYSCGIIIIIRHGLRSPFLFAFAFWLYESSHSRLMANNAFMWPVMIAGFFTLISINRRLPPSLGVWAEIFIVMRVVNVIEVGFLFLVLIFFLGLLYNIYLYVTCIHAKFNNISGKIHLFPVIQVVLISFSSPFILDVYHI